MLMQAYDFLHLLDTSGCTLQIGGNDQWGNITAGIELIRRLRSKSAYGLTIPLMTTASGQKLGKTEEGAVWLDRERTSPFQFYQYWVRTDDRDAIKYLKLFTYMPAHEIKGYQDLLQKNPEKREAQRRLAREVTLLVHSEEDALKAEKASEFLYGAEISGLSDSELEEIFTDVPSTTKAKNMLIEGIKLVDLLAETGLAASKGAARKLLSAGGIYINNRREDSPDKVVHRDDLASERIVLLRSGKKNYHLVRFE
jgi:tyrosyl-tRNA synthetase